MDAQNITRKILCVTAAFLLSASAHAQWKVFDVGNAKNHITTSLESALTTIISTDQYAELIRSNMGSFSLVEQQEKSKELEALMALNRSNRNLYSALGGGKSAMETISAAFATGNHRNFDDFLSSIGERRAAGDATATRLYDTSKIAFDQIDAANKQQQQILQNVPYVAGATEAAQATTNMVGVLVNQNNVMLATMAAQNAKVGVEVQATAAEREAREKALADAAKNFRDAAQRDMQRLQGVR